MRESSWVGAGVVAAHSMAGHLAGRGNPRTLLRCREVNRALLCKLQLGGDLRVEPHAREAWL